VSGVLAVVGAVVVAAWKQMRPLEVTKQLL